jgi:LPXTG-motif cell wall-anchored protein
VLPLTGGADGLSLVPVLMAGLLLSMIGVVLRRRAAPRR